MDVAEACGDDEVGVTESRRAGANREQARRPLVEAMDGSVRLEFSPAATPEEMRDRNQAALTELDMGAPQIHLG
jgi:hypothetical protein